MCCFSEKALTVINVVMIINQVVNKCVFVLTEAWGAARGGGAGAGGAMTRRPPP